MRHPVALLLLCLFATPSPAKVTEFDQLQTYPVHQRPGSSLLAALNNASPIREDGRIYHGNTAWDIRWSFRWDRNASGLCQILGVATKLSVTITLPELKSGTVAGQAEFQKYLRALQFHEEGHKKIAQEAASAADYAISTLPPMTSCKALASEAQRQGNAILDNARKAGQDYDATTRHGHTQGACLDC
jgi:predicted secreted Zn-dependent protease